ncbi:MAG: type II toxin-antitoxin system VapB family antitoxin [Devosia sp.]
MRTNIDIDDELMAGTLKYSGKPTKKAAVEEAMRHYNRAMIMQDIIESTRGIGWDDGLATRPSGLNEDKAHFEREE